MHILFFTLAALFLTQVGTADVPSLVDQVRNAATRYPATNFPMLTASKKKPLMEALRKADNWLSTLSAEEKAQWRAHLKWEQLDELLAAPSPDTDTLREILNAWRVNDIGLDAPHFVACQKALREYVWAEELASEGNPGEQYRLRMERLATLLSRYSADMAPEQIMEMGNILGILEFTNQASPLVAEIRKELNHPNMVVRISSRLIAFSAAGNPVKNEKTSRNVIAGVTTVGTAYTTGTLTSRSLPAKEGQAAVEVRLDANVSSPDNRGHAGRRGQIAIASSSASTGVVTKRLIIDENGIHPDQSQVKVSTQSQVKDIEAKRALAERIAWRRASKQQGQANQEASAIVASNLVTEFDKSLADQIKKSEEEFGEKLKRTLTFQGTYPRNVSFSSSNLGLDARILEADRSQLGASSVAPELKQKADLELNIHETFVGNYMEPYLGNKTEWDYSWYKIHKMLTLEEPEELRVHDNATRWSFRVTKERPITAKFRDGKIYMTIRGTGIYRKEVGKDAEKNHRPFELAVAYIPVVENNQVMGQRDGEVEITYTDNREASALDELLRTMLKTNMSAFFAPKMELGGLMIPKGSAWEKYTQLEIQELRVQDGWISAGYLLRN